jgi:hypothetical protein
MTNDAAQPPMTNDFPYGAATGCTSLRSITRIVPGLSTKITSWPRSSA